MLYSSQFAGAVEILQWQLLGVLGRVIVWPVGFVFLAKGSARAFLLIELFSNVLHTALIWFGMSSFGLRGIGMAFAGLYFLSCLLQLPLVNRLTGFTWTKKNLLLILGSVFLTSVVFAATSAGSTRASGLLVGGSLTVLAAVFSFRRLCQRMGYTTAQVWAACYRKLTTG